MAQASKLSITQLQQAIKNGTVPSYIGVPLLQQKIKESQQAKQAMAAQQPQQPPVAQQVMQQAESQGVDTLPSNLPVQGMAGGGIIAFDEGGEAKDPDPYGYWAEQKRAEKARAPYVEGYKDMALAPYRILNKSADYLTSSIGDAFGNMRDKNTMVIDPDTGKPISKYELKRKTANAVGKDAATQYRATGNLDAPTNQPFSITPRPLGDVSGALKSGEVNPLMAGATRGESAQANQGQGQSEAEIRAQYAGSNAPRGGPQGNAGIDAFRIKPAQFDDTYLQKIVEGDNNPATGKPWTPEEITAKRRAEEEKAGIKDIYGGQESDLAKLKDKYEKGSKLDEAMPWLAFAEQVTKPTKAGEAPPSFIGSLLGGAATAGRVKGELTDKQEAKLDKIRVEANQLAQAKNAFAQAQINGDRAEIKSAEDTLNSHYKAFSDFGMKKSEADALAEAETKKMQLQNTMNERSVGATYYAADKAERNVNQVAMQIQLDNAKAGTPISKSEATKQAYAVINPGFGAIDQRDIASQRTTLSNQLKELRKDIMLAPEVRAKQIKLLEAKINALDSGASPMAAIPEDVSAIMSQYSKG